MSDKGVCWHCGKETISPAVQYCEECFLMELRKYHPKIKFLKADGTETEKIEECVYIQGIKLKKRYYLGDQQS